MSVLDSVIDYAVARTGSAHDAVSELREERPDATPQHVIDDLTERYLKVVARTGGAVGAVAAVPAVGTAVAVVLTAGQTAAFLRASATYVMSVASVHGVEVDDLDRRRTLFLAALLGEDGAQAVQGQIGLSTLFWARSALTRLPIGTVKAVNRTLTRRLAAWGVTRLGSLALGRLAPFGLGAVIGYAGTKVIGKNVVEGAAEAFGPAPAAFEAASARSSS